MRSLQTYLLVNRRDRYRQHGQRTLQNRLSRLGLGLGAILGLVVVLISLLWVLAYADLTRDLPSPAALGALLDPPDGLLLQPTRLYDRSGQHLLMTLENPGVTRRIISINPNQPEHFPQDLITVTLATVDPNFWNHPGFNLFELTPSRLLSQSEPVTLAERLVTDLLLVNEAPGLRRNLRQDTLAAQLTARYGRSRILEWYLNNAYYGHLAYGAEAAAQLYFGKPASSLNLAEAVLLAGVALAPALNPLDAPEAARTQQRHLLNQLAGTGVFTAAQVKGTLNTPLVFRQADQTKLQKANGAAGFTSEVIKELSTSLGQERIERGGLVVTTTLDYDLQQQVACSVTFLLAQTREPDGQNALPDSNVCPAARLLPTQFLDQAGKPSDLAVSAVVLDPRDGQILALLGDRSAMGEAAFLVSHPTGSLLTPFIYLAGFTRGDGPASLVWDIPVSLPPMASNESNPDGKYHGPLRLRVALANDYLAPAAQLLAQIGPENVWGQAKPFGLNSLVGERLPYAGGALTPIEAAQAFGVFADQGILYNSYTVLRVDGAKIPSFEPSGLTPVQPTARPILSASLSYLMNQVLSDESARWPSLGYSNPLEIGRPAGAKLGQVAGGQSTWSVGYTPQRVVAVWVGSQQLQPIVSGTAGGNDNSSTALASVDPRLAASLWHAIIQYASQGLQAAGWETPTGISQVEVCDPSGLLATQACPNLVNEVFLSDNVPTNVDSLYRTFEINRETGRLATVFTPVDKVEEKTFLVAPPEARSWAEMTGLPVPPTLYDAIQAPVSLPDTHITSPGLFSTIHGQVTIRGTAAGSDFLSYQLQVGQGLNPKNWVQVGDQVSTLIIEAPLGVWDTQKQPDGLYAVRLLVVHKDQHVETAVIQVTLDNTPPVVSVVYPTQGQAIHYSADFSLVLKAQTSDAVGLDRLEWWVDGQKIGSLSQAPFNLLWEGQPGQHQLVIKAYDRAGNQAGSQPVTFDIVK